jgi:transposase
MGVELGTAGISSPSDLIDAGLDAALIPRVDAQGMNEVRWVNSVYPGYVRVVLGRDEAPGHLVSCRDGPRNRNSRLRLIREQRGTGRVVGKRKRYSAAFKAKVALEAIRGEATIAELVSKHGVHQTLINAWKRQAIEGMAGVFSGKAEAAAAAREGELEKLHAKIGKLVVERDFFAKASGR